MLIRTRNFMVNHKKSIKSFASKVDWIASVVSVAAFIVACSLAFLFIAGDSWFESEVSYSSRQVVSIYLIFGASGAVFHSPIFTGRSSFSIIMYCILLTVATPIAAAYVSKASQMTDFITSAGLYTVAIVGSLIVILPFPLLAEYLDKRGVKNDT